jgi:hypothetical protein
MLYLIANLVHYTVHKITGEEAEEGSFLFGLSNRWLKADMDKDDELQRRMDARDERAKKKK